MNYFVQAVAAVLLASILVLILKQSGKGIGELLSILICVMVVAIAIVYLQPLRNFILTIKNMTALDGEMVTIIFKAVGISITAEITSLICEDSGCNALGKSVQLLASAVIVGLMIPMLTQLLNLIEGVLSGL